MKYLLWIPVGTFTSVQVNLSHLPTCCPLNFICLIILCFFFIMLSHRGHPAKGQPHAKLEQDEP